MEDLLRTISFYMAENSLLALPVVYLGGVIVSFTPCVYPVAPLTVAFIGAHSAGSRWRGFRLSLFYVLGMALTYTVLGGVAAFTGQLFGKVQSNPWSYFLLANVFIVMGLFILGALSFTLRTPELSSDCSSGKKLTVPWAVLLSVCCPGWWSPPARRRCWPSFFLTLPRARVPFLA